MRAAQGVATPLKKVVYIVDDDPSVQKAMGRLLQSAGMDARVFDSAKALLDGEAPACDACLVVDYRMPGLTGFGLVEELGRRGIQLPFIVLSANDDPDARRRARELGAAAYFRKPVDGQALLDAIAWATGDGVKESP